MAKQEKDLKEILASNLVFFRKNAKLTQLDIAEKFNYSDKAISKWERGECAPDIFVLKALADFYGVSLTDLFKDKPKANKLPNKNLKHIIITALSATLVFLVATVFYVLFTFIFTATSIDPKYTWLAYIVAIPASFIVCIVFSSLWGNKLLTAIAISCLVWSATLAVYLPIELMTPFPNLGLLWIIPVPLQLMIILWFLLKSQFKFFKKNKNNNEH